MCMDTRAWLWFSAVLEQCLLPMWLSRYFGLITAMSLPPELYQVSLKAQLNWKINLRTTCLLGIIICSCCVWGTHVKNGVKFVRTQNVELTTPGVGGGRGHVFGNSVLKVQTAKEANGIWGEWSESQGQNSPSAWLFIRGPLRGKTTKGGNSHWVSSVFIHTH